MPGKKEYVLCSKTAMCFCFKISCA